MHSEFPQHNEMIICNMLIRLTLYSKPKGVSTNTSSEKDLRLLIISLRIFKFLEKYHQEKQKLVHKTENQQIQGAQATRNFNLLTESLCRQKPISHVSHVQNVNTYIGICLPYIFCLNTIFHSTIFRSAKSNFRFKLESVYPFYPCMFMFSDYHRDGRIWVPPLVLFT